MGIAGHATTEGTARYAARHDTCGQGHFRKSKTLSWSSIGIGTYLGGGDDKTDALVADAVSACLRGGINVIDSAANYRRERGEKSAGAALAKMFDSGDVQRDEVLVCTKGGYLPHGGDWFAKTYLKAGGNISADDLVGGSHCMHPDYLESQLEQSRANLSLDTIDVYYIHNPESQADKVDEDTFWARIEAAFGMLEGAVQAGKIRTYGIASWNAFRADEGVTAHMSLVRAKALAQKAAGAGRDHFQHVQMPFNLAMPQALRRPTQRVGEQPATALRTATAMALRVFASGSIRQDKIGRLADYVIAALGSDLTSDAQRALQFTRSAPGVGTALIGLKQPAHVEEALALCRQSPLPAADIMRLVSRY